MPGSVLSTLDGFIDTNRLGDQASIIEAVEEMGTDKAQELVSAFEGKYSSAIATSDPRFTFIADSRLSGLPVYCSHPRCRSDYQDSAINFAALFADRFYISNPFSRTSLVLDHPSTSTYEKVIEVAMNISFLLKARPLLEAGILAFNEYSVSNYCSSCALEVALDSKKTDEASNYIFDYFYDTTSLKYDEIAGRRVVKIKFGEQHGEHEIIQDLYSRPDDFDVGKRLSRESAKKLNIFSSNITGVAHEYFLKNVEAKRLNSQRILTNAPEKAIVEKASNIQTTRLTYADYPILSGISLSKVLELRDSKWKHFEKFRNEVDALLVEKGNADEVCREIEAKEIELSQRIETHRQQAKNKAYDSAVPSIFAIGAAVSAAGSQPLAAAILGALGGGHITKNTFSAVRDALSVPPELKSSPYYFSWKLKDIRE